MSSTATGGHSGTVTANTAKGAYLPIVRIHLLGSMRATSYLGDDVLPRAKKARAALAYLCLASDARVPRERVARMLWDRVSAKQARTSLRKYLVQLTSAMGPLAGELLSARRATISLNTSVCWIDARALVKSPYSDSARADLAVLCTGELLDGFDDVSASFGNWLTRERVRFKERLAGSLDIVLQRVDRDEFDAKQVANLARRLISFDATHQGASRALMRALARSGDREEALCEFDRHREALWNAFRVKPALESERLYQTLRQQVSRKGASSALATTHDQPQTRVQRSRLRVGVSPFNVDCKTEKGLAISLRHEIAAGLSRFRWFDVVTPRNEEYSDDLDYMIDGSISAKGSELQISVRLLELSGQVQPVWTERFDIALRELHRLDELVTMLIVARIDPIILHIEGRPKRRERYGATGLLLQAIPLIFSMERKQYEQAGELIEQALVLEPDNARAEAWAAHWHNLYIGQGWAKDIHKATEKMQRHALRAITLDPENAEALGIYAFSIARMTKDYDRALLVFDRALRLNPSSAFVWALSALTYCYIGEPDIALQRLRRYRELGSSPDLYCYEHVYTIAYTFKGDYERAVLVGQRAVKTNPSFVAGYKPLIASLGHLGRRDEAQGYVRKLLALEPNFTVEWFGQFYSFKKQSDRDRYLKGLRLAGVPER